MSWKNAKGGFVYWLNRFLNPDHPWTTYWDPTTGEEKPDDTLRDDHASYGAGSLQSDSLLGTIGKGVNALITKWTDAGATGGEIERNAMQMQNAEDIYQRQVVGMQKAGLNPALMYGSGSGAGNAPGVNTAGSAPGINMSDLMQAFLMKKQGNLLDAQARNLDADTGLKGSQKDKVRVEIDEVRKSIESIGLSNDAQRIANQYLDKMYKADIDLKISNKEYFEHSAKELDAVINKMDYDNLATLFKCCEAVENINLMISEGYLNESRAKYFVAECSYLEKQGKILDLTERDWDYINVLGSSSAGFKAGPFGANDSRPVTLAELKNQIQQRMDEKSKDKDKSKNPMNPSGYDGPIYD